jgi:hypothetical protein
MNNSGSKRNESSTIKMIELNFLILQSQDRTFADILVYAMVPTAISRIAWKFSTHLTTAS